MPVLELTRGGEGVARGAWQALGKQMNQFVQYCIEKYRSLEMLRATENALALAPTAATKSPSWLGQIEKHVCDVYLLLLVHRARQCD